MIMSISSHFCTARVRLAFQLGVYARKTRFFPSALIGPEVSISWFPNELSRSLNDARVQLFACTPCHPRWSPACARKCEPDDVMTARSRNRPAAICTVLLSVFRHWLEQPLRAAMVAGEPAGCNGRGPLHAGVLRPSRRRADQRRRQCRRAPCGLHGVRRKHRGAGTDRDDPAAPRPALQSDRAEFTLQIMSGRGARCLQCGRAAFLHPTGINSFAGSTVCARSRAVQSARPAQRHDSDGADALDGGAAGLDDPARAALGLRSAA